MNLRVLLFLWIAAQAMQIMAGSFAPDQRPVAKNVDKRLLVAAIASILPLITLVLFLALFVIGGSSNIAQLAGEEGHNLWRIWFHAWPVLLFGNPLAFVVLVVTLACPPFHLTRASFVCRTSGLIAAGCATYAVITFFPDA